MATTVANKHQLDQVYPQWVKDPDYVYIGRQKGMHFGNPFSHQSGTLAMLKVVTRADAVQAFEDWLSGKAHQEIEPARREWILNNMWRLRDKVLVCFCSPQPCHGNVYIRFLYRN